MSVDILMATHNGGKYLRNQLLSLQQQTFSDWQLWIRDDGSSDETLNIIRDFSRIDGRIRLVNDASSGLGAGKNFLGLTKYAKAEYVIFCDQDDIWFEKKLELLLEHAKSNFSDNVPCLVYCDAHGYSDQEGVITIKSVSLLHALSIREFLFFNSGYQGCSMLFNRPLCQMASKYRAEFFHMHDDVVALLAHVFGRVHFLPKALMLYRQHARNVTVNIPVGFVGKLTRMFSRQAFVLSELHFLEKKSFYDAYRDEMSSDDCALFRAYLSYPHRSVLGRLWIVLRHGFSIGGYRLPLVVKTLLRRPLG